MTLANTKPCDCGGQLCRYCAPTNAGVLFTSEAARRRIVRRHLDERHEAMLTPEQALMLTGQQQMLIYVAGPYSVKGQPATDAVVRQVERHLQAAVDVAQELLQLGHFPFIPHTHTYGYAVRANELSYEQFMEWDEQLLTRCDAILRFARSPGADQEFERAGKMGLLLFETIEEIPECRTSTPVNETPSTAPATAKGKSRTK